jgi:hypothetical protein
MPSTRACWSRASRRAVGSGGEGAPRAGGAGRLSPRPYCPPACTRPARSRRWHSAGGGARGRTSSSGRRVRQRDLRPRRRARAGAARCSRRRHGLLSSSTPIDVTCERSQSTVVMPVHSERAPSYPPRPRSLRPPPPPPPPCPGLTPPTLPEPGRLGGRSQEQLDFLDLSNRTCRGPPASGSLRGCCGGATRRRAPSGGALAPSTVAKRGRSRPSRRAESRTAPIFL